MLRLRVELGRKPYNLFAGDNFFRALNTHADSKIVEPFDHRKTPSPTLDGLCLIAPKTTKLKPLDCPGRSLMTMAPCLDQLEWRTEQLRKRISIMTHDR